jgi:hypothetical protein
LLVAPVRLESALAGAVHPAAPEAAADVPVPITIDDSPDDDGDVGIGWASPCSICGTVDNDDERCDATACAWVPADVPVACATAVA